MKALSAAATRATQEGEYLALAMIDVDDFKRVNAAHGHDGGDALLAAVAKRVQGVVRKSESAYRYGGGNSRSSSTAPTRTPQRASPSASAWPSRASRSASTAAARSR